MPAVFYEKSAFNTSGSDLVGARVANYQFLNALVGDDRIPEVACYAREQKDFDDFCNVIEPSRPAGKTISSIFYGDYAGLSRAGVLHLPNPDLTPHLWRRRYYDQRLYSLTGVFHTISSREAMEAIGNLVVAPVQPWDALICTSRTQHQAVTTIMTNWAEYLATRLNARPEIKIKLPVIPLGIDCDAFQTGAAAADMRSETRARLEIGEGDIVVLFVGRLAFRRKSHPVPMYLALQRAQEATGARLHFIQAGYFEDEHEQKDFEAAAREFCPDVRTHIIGGEDLFRGQSIWYAGDIFLSLADNIQETFGLTPVEAMAAGLPAVVSDWDGYRDTIRDGVDGFLIPTTLPSPPAGLDLAASYNELGTFRYHYGVAATSTAVDVHACAQALSHLIREPALRHRLGQSGRQRARETYDWRVVMTAYRQLWDTLAEVRRSAQIVAPVARGQAPYPLCDDPFRVFGQNATRSIAPDLAVALDDQSDVELLDQLEACAMTRFAANWRLDRELTQTILNRVRQFGEMTITQIASEIDAPASHLQRTIAYLLKFGLLRVRGS